VKHPSASSCEQLVHCPASHALPQREHHNAKNMRGTEHHEVLAGKINGRVPKAPEKAQKAVSDLKIIETVCDGVESLVAEPAYAVDVKSKTARLLGVDLNRQYGDLGKYEIPTTLDVKGIKNGLPWFNDWKFGSHSTQYQLLVQAMAVSFSQEAGRPSFVEGGVTYIDLDSRQFYSEFEKFYLSDLDDAADALVAAIDARDVLAAEFASGAIVKTVEGPWCQYCPALPYCPSRAAMVKQLVSITGLLHELRPDEKAYVHFKLKELEDMVETARDTMKNMLLDEYETAKNEGALSYGWPSPKNAKKHLTIFEKPGWKYFDRDATYQLLKTLGASKEQIDNAMKTRATSIEVREMKK
jgi:hypothetical protein